MLPQQRNRYDSFLIWLYAQEKDNLIPGHIKRLIPHSTASTWRNIDFSSFIGHELREIQQEAISQYEIYQNHQTLKRVVFVLTRVWLAVYHILIPVLLKQKQHIEILITELQRLFVVIPKKTALRLTGISPSSFHAHLNRLKFQCKLSPLQLCIRKHPLQLATAEVTKIKSLFAEPAFACWPAVSVYYEGIRNHGLYISLSTFYKYVNLLGLKRKWKKHISKKNGLKSVSPNQYMHVDTTIWKLDNGAKAFIAIVNDNFSKMIIGWNVCLQNKAGNVMEALDQAVKNIQRFHPNQVSSTVVADGGSENHAATIDELLSKPHSPEITKMIALKDICFSNSPVEAINKIIKRYLRHHTATTYEQLHTLLPQIIKDYNETRPHGSLNGLTPLEAYTGPDSSLNFREQFHQAKSLRIAQNRKQNCRTCG